MGAQISSLSNLPCVNEEHAEIDREKVSQSKLLKNVRNFLKRILNQFTGKSTVDKSLFQLQACA